MKVAWKPNWPVIILRPAQLTLVMFQFQVIIFSIKKKQIRSIKLRGLRKMAVACHSGKLKALKVLCILGLLVAG